MGVLENLGASNPFSGISGQGFLFWGGIIFLAFVILIVSGVIIFFYYGRKSKKTQFKNKIPIYVSVNGKPKKVGTDYAKEIYVPDSNISLFYLKINKIYIARPTRAMGKNEYWYSISENGEWVNFDLSTNTEDNTLAKANYDHRDTRYAYVNLKEIIKKNYKDKSLVWWKDPVIMNIISFVIMSIIFVGGCWFLIAKMGHLISELAPIAKDFNNAANVMAEAVKNAQNINSGVVSVS